MGETEKVGLGRFVLRTKQYLVTLRPFGKGIALQTMYFADEIRDQEETAGVPGKVAITPREVALAKQLIEALSAPFALAKFKDTYRDRVEELLQKKARGETITVERPAEEPGKVVDLMEALKASLAGSGGGGARPAKRRGARKAKGKSARAA
jgi:DNA end-binding protein Ku